MNKISRTKCDSLSSILLCLCLEKPKFVKKVVSSRKLRSIDITSFRTDIERSVLLQHQDDIHVAVNNYDEVLRSLMDKYAPVKERVIHCPSLCALVYSRSHC